MNKILFVFLFLLFAFQGRSQVYDTIDIHFDLNDSKLNSEAGYLIDTLLHLNILFKGQELSILGFTDYLGSVAYNEALSKERAQHVKDYLYAKGLNGKDIVLCLGKGKIDHEPVSGNDGIPSDRKVQIILIHDPSKPFIPTIITAKTPKKNPFNFNTIKVNQAIPLKDVLFVTGTHKLLPGSDEALKNLFSFLKENPTVKIQIEGHVCCLSKNPDFYNMRYVLGNDTGLLADSKAKILYEQIIRSSKMDKGIEIDQPDDDHTGLLSVNRATAIFKYLVNKGIDSNRLKHVGLGAAWPLYYPASTVEQENLNKRVGVRILSK